MAAETVKVRVRDLVEGDQIKVAGRLYTITNNEPGYLAGGRRHITAIEVAGHEFDDRLGLFLAGHKKMTVRRKK